MHDFKNDPILKSLLSSLEQGIAIFSPDRTLLFVNDAMKSVTGVNGGVGSSLNELIKKHQLQTEGGEPVAFADFPIERAFLGHETKNKVYRYTSPDGVHVSLNVSCFVIRDSTGAAAYIVTTVRNITERKKREEKLRFMVESAKILSITQDVRERLAEKARLAVPSLADWCAIDVLNNDDSIDRIAIVHRDPKMITFVEEFVERYAAERDGPTGLRTLIKTITPRFVPLVTSELIDAAALTPEHRRDIERLQLKSLMTIPIIARGRGVGAMTLAFAESGRVYTEEDFRFFQDFCGHLGVLLDNAHLYEEIKKRDHAKDLFLASLSHELRNPLAPIKSSLEMLSLKDVSEEVREEIVVIEHQFDHMTRLLQDLLDVTRFTSGKIALTKKRLELSQLVAAALKAAEPLLRRADISLTTRFATTPVMVEADETRIEQAVTNLISNAIKFTPPGGALSVSVHATDESALIEVVDTGVGIAPEDADKIFELYFQGANDKNAGLGIGLTLVKNIVALHDGTIGVKSAGVGLGSTFTIRLPLAKTEATDTSLSSAPTKAAQNISVLIVDDNAPAADSLAKLMNRIGMRAEARYSAREALEAATPGSYDVLLLDIGMPEMDGYELVKRLRERGIDSPIVALTGYGLAEDKQKARDAGFTAHLTKPIGLQEIRELFASFNIPQHP